MTATLFDVTPDWSREPWVVREAPVSGRDWTLRWHYSAVVPAGGNYYGVFCRDLIAVVAVGTPVGNPIGVAGKLGLSAWPGNMEITRVVCHPDAPKNTASRAIAAVLRYVHRARGVDWVFSYADTGQGHHGGIYQALNATYVGVTDKTSGPAYRLNGLVVTRRTIHKIFGTDSSSAVYDLAMRRGMSLEKIPDHVKPKHTYVLPCAGPAINRAIRRHLAPLALPYPKRTAVAA